MMNSKENRLSVLLLSLMAAILVVLPACKGNNKDEAPKSLAERIIGKWNVTGVYTKQNGEWTNTIGEDEEGWFEFRSDSTVTIYRRSGDMKSTMKVKWSVDETTSILTITKEGQAYSAKMVFENDDRFAFHYTSTVNPSTGEDITGEFKEVLQRDNKIETKFNASDDTMSVIR